MKLNGNLYEDSLTSYFYLDQRINNGYEALEEMRYRHENRNYYTCTEFHDLGFSSRNFNLEREVNDFADAERLAFKRIKRLKKRQSRFKQLLKRLDPNEQYYLKQKYEEGKAIKEQPHTEEKAIAIHEEMEDYKHQLSRYRQSSHERAERFKEQRIAKQTLEQKRRQARANDEYSKWLESIQESEELAQRLEERGILDRLKNLQA